jgi:alpha-ketoglutarate-dependent taurine dioxygenase
MNALRERLEGPVLSPAAWKGSELERDSWIVRLDADDVADIDRALAHARSTVSDWRQLTRDDFPLERMAKRFVELDRELRQGRGFLVLRGLDIRRYPASDVFLVWMGLCSWLGVVVPQNKEGELIGAVTDGGLVKADEQGHLVPASASAPGDDRNPNFRQYKSRADLRFHNDSADLVGLLCVQSAKSGGMSTVTSSMAVYNTLLAEAPEALEHLYEGFHYDVRGEGPSRNLSEVTRHKVPVFSYFEGRLSCRFNPKPIETAQLKTGVPLSPERLAAVRLVERLAGREDLRLDMWLEPGDMQILNNLVMLHSRTEFEDWPEPQRRRLLLRAWINLRDGPRLAPEFANRYNAGERTGIPQVPA